MGQSKDTYQTPTDAHEDDGECAYCNTEFHNRDYPPDLTAYYQREGYGDGIYDKYTPTAPSKPRLMSGALPDESDAQTYTAVSSQNQTQMQVQQAGRPSQGSLGNTENPTVETDRGGLYRPSDRAGVGQNPQTTKNQKTRSGGEESVGGGTLKSLQRLGASLRAMTSRGNKK